MFSRARIAGIALGLAFSGSPLYVQAQVGESDEQRQSAPEQNLPQDPRWTLPVEIVEDQAEAEARKRREERAEQRELDELAAQQGMDESTEKMADYALYQTILIAIGTGALIYTLYLTRQANRAAVEAVKVTREIGQVQARAYVGVELRGGILMDTASDAPAAFWWIG